jgi:hypothetical protein
MTREELNKLCTITATYGDWMLSVDLIEASIHEAHCKEYNVNQSGRWPAKLNHVRSVAFEPHECVLETEDERLELPDYDTGCPLRTVWALIREVYALSLDKKAEIKAARNPSMSKQEWSDTWEAMCLCDRLAEIAARESAESEEKGAA